MNVLLILDSYPADSQFENKYALLAEEFSRNGHNVYIVSCQDHSIEKGTMLTVEASVTVLRMRKHFLHHNPYLKDVFLPKFFLRQVRYYLKGIGFDLIVSATPSLISSKTILILKKYYQCSSYLLLRGLFPHVNRDLELIHNPILLYSLKRKEKRLYDHSNWIGCISPETMKYLAAQYPLSFRKKLDYLADWSTKPLQNLSHIREKLKLQKETQLVVFEHAPEEELAFLLDIAEENRDNENLFFIITGKTVKEDRSLIDSRGLKNVIFLSSNMKTEREKLLGDADIGLILLNRQLSVPVVPSHIGSFMNAGLPIIACENPFTHFSFIIKEAACGLVCYTGNLKHFQRNLNRLLSDDGMRECLGENGRMYAEKELTAEKAYKTIMKHFQD
ncbi:glycosyltransferase family 4 protein [Metabacillus sp. RGM 3146]|uniref:glycosyltransferase family 4 protein n=1 Tax=Metabacillus sp. RGM 3146 TaxID=3401092 RepID=UPI003B9B2990